jgi:hypothetical protein
MSHHALAFAITATAEIAIASLWSVATPRSFCKRDLLLAVTAVNLISHPLAWMIFAALPDAFWLIEGTVVVAEAIGLAVLIELPKKDAIAISLIGNLATAALSALWISC